MAESNGKLMPNLLVKRQEKNPVWKQETRVMQYKRKL